MKRPALWICLAWGTGALLSGKQRGWPLWVGGLLLLGILFLCYLTKRRMRIWCIFLSLLFLLGGVYHQSYWRQLHREQERLSGQHVFSGIVTSHTSTYSNLRVSRFGIWSYSIRLYGESLPKTGTRVRVYGIFSEVPSPTNPGEFNRRAFYENKGILGTCKAEQITVLRQPGRIRGGMSRLSEQLGERIRQLFAAEQYGIIQAMFLGERGEVSEEVNETLREFGAAHILAVSGMHVGVLAGMVVLMLRPWMRRKYTPAAAIGWIACFGLLTGLSVSCIRAIGMFVCSAVGRVGRKSYDRLTALGILYLGTILVSPGLLWDLGTQLSYGAVLVLSLICPVWVSKGRGFWGRLRMAAGTSAVFFLSMLPFTAWNQYRFSPLSVLVNLCVVGGISCFFCLCLFAIAVSYVWYGGGTLLAGLSGFLFDAVLLLCRLLERLPFSIVVTGKPTVAGVCGYVLAMAVLTVLTAVAGNRVRYWGYWLAAVGLLWHPRPSGALFYALDVGQGDCSVLLHGSHAIVVDCGGSAAKPGTGVLQPFLYYHGYGGIDLVIVSHMDADHTKGLRELYEGKLPIQNTMLLDDLAGEAEDWKQAYPRKSSWIHPEKGERYRLGTDTVTVVYPEGPVEESSNDNSLVCLIAVDTGRQQYRLLFPGDLGTSALEMISAETGPVTVVKAPHHGSRGASSYAVYERLAPSYVTISAGKNNRYGHPHPETIAILEELAIPYGITGVDGALGVYFD